MTALGARLEDEHRAGLGVRGPAGQVRERGVRAERVVGVVAALLELRPAGTTRRLPGKAAETASRRRGRERAPARAPAGGSRGARPTRSRWCRGSPGRTPDADSPCCSRGSRWPRGEFGRAGRVAVACGAHASSLARRRRDDRVSRPARAARSAGGGRCPTTSIERSTSDPVGFQSTRGHDVVDRRAEQRRASRSIQVPTPPLPVSAAASWQRPSVPPSTPETGHVVDRRVEVAGHDHVGVDALVREPLQVVAPVLHVALTRGDGVRGDDDRSVAGGRHRDGARHGRGVARSVERGLDHGVVAEFRRDQKRRRAGIPLRRRRSRRGAPTSGDRGRASRGRPSRRSRSSSRAASRCRHPSPRRSARPPRAAVADPAVFHVMTRMLSSVFAGSVSVPSPRVTTIARRSRPRRPRRSGRRESAKRAHRARDREEQRDDQRAAAKAIDEQPAERDDLRDRVDALDAGRTTAT